MKPLPAGICSWAFPRAAGGRREPAELAACAAETGFIALEGAFSPRGRIAVGRPKPAALAVDLASLGTLELHRVSLLDEAAPRREAAAAGLEGLVDCAAAWQIETVSSSLGRKAAECETAARRDEIDVFLHSLLERAHRAGVRFLVENVPGHLPETRAEVRELLASFPELRLCLDLDNAECDAPAAAWVEEFGPKVLKVHLSASAVHPGRDLPALLQGCRGAALFIEELWDGQSDDREMAARVAAQTRSLLELALA